MRSILLVSALVSTLAFACTQNSGAVADQGQASALSASSPSKQGRVSVSQYRMSNPTIFDVRADAAFSATATAASTGCTSVRVGSACTLSTCQGTPTGGGGSSESAGDIAIATASQNVALNFNDQLFDYGFQVDQSKALFLGGEAVSVNAAGGAAVPGFKTSLVAPTAITLTSPVVSNAGCSFSHLGGDMDLAWSGGAAGDTVNITFVGGTNESLECSFDAGGGKANVPFAGGLEHILQSSKAVFGSTVSRTKTVDAGAYRVEVALVQQMLGCYFDAK